MPATAALADCQKLCSDIVKAGGSVPTPLQRLLDAADILMAPGDTRDVLTPILDRALAGELEPKQLDRLLASAASAQQVAEFRRDLRQLAEPAVVARFHAALGSGCADDVLASLRNAFDEAAEGLVRARAAGINAESDPSHILATGDANTTAEWRALPGYLAVVGRVGAIARQFGVGVVAQFPQIRPYTGAENFRVNDSALMCCAGDLIAESAMFASPDPIGHRTSPWARASLRLNTISEAAERYRGFAEVEFDKVNSRDPGGWIDEQGAWHSHPRPANPYKRENTNA